MKKVIDLFFLLMVLAAVHAHGQDLELKAKSNKLSVNFSGNAPAISWIKPAEDNSSSANRLASLQLGIKSESEIASVTITHNNNPLPLTRGLGRTQSSLSPFHDEVLDFTVTLADGSNIIQVEVVNEQNSSTLAQRTITFAPAVVARNDYALLFATDEFDEWDDLNNPVNDARAIAKELEQNYGYKVELITNPSRSEIQLKLREYSAKSYQPKDQLMIFFAGHGKFDEVTRIGYLVCKDSQKADVVGDTYIDHSRLRDLINNIPCDHIFLVIDACFGGTFDQTIARAGTRGGPEFFEVSKSEFIERKLRYKTRKYLTSGGKVYVPDGRPGMHSPFTRKLLEAFRNYGGTDGILAYSEIVSYFTSLVPEPMTGDFGISEPGSDFIFVTR